MSETHAQVSASAVMVGGIPPRAGQWVNCPLCDNAHPLVAMDAPDARLWFRCGDLSIEVTRD
jgi:hypothetical protein